MTAAAAQPTPQTRAPAARIPKQNFFRATRSEWIKIRTLRSTWITSMIAVFLTVLFGAGSAIAYAKTEGMSDSAAGGLITGTTFGEIVVAVLGALVITGEYSSGQIRSTLAAVPRRTRVFAAKSLVIAIWSFLLGVISLLLSWLVAAPFMGDEAPSFSDTHIVGFIWGTGLAFAGIALLSLGMGYLVRSTAGAITVVVILLFIISIPLSLMAMKWHWAANVSSVMPSSVVQSVTDPFTVSGQTTWADTNPSLFLTHTQAVLIFGAWVLVPLIAGWFVFSKRDA
ncbi:ABC transporter permease subunit [Actinomyces sp. oral taxon 448]|jgi:putative integral membrane transport protein|uniref:ABC transporter permease subunit n=1 Tax=Actinomyces sp. oral taxon 448 TaxID=712124 RepID=UPI0025BE4C56|nr:ABC transporter permease subunit [Actinomyces sp. oral taxon 448]